MSATWRNVLALLGGALAAGLLIMASEAFAVRSYPPPAGSNLADPAGLRAFLATRPAGAFLWRLAGEVTGALAGVYLATRFSRRRPSRQGRGLGLVLLVAAVIHAVRDPLPLWYVAASLAGIAAATWLGVELGRPRLTD